MSMCRKEGEGFSCRAYLQVQLTMEMRCENINTQATEMRGKTNSTCSKVLQAGEA